MAADADAELREQSLRDGAGGHARRRLARRRALEDVARVVAIVLEDAGEIGVTGTHPRDRAFARSAGASASRGAGSMISCQFFQSRLRMSIAIGPTRASRRRVRRRGISTASVLDLHAAPATVALLASRELGVDVRRKQRQASGHAFEHAHEGLAVRFACGGETEDHAVNLSAPPSVRMAARRAARSLLLTVQA